MVLHHRTPQQVVAEAQRDFGDMALTLEAIADSGLDPDGLRFFGAYARLRWTCGRSGYGLRAAVVRQWH